MYTELQEAILEAYADGMVDDVQTAQVLHDLDKIFLNAGSTETEEN